MVSDSSSSRSRTRCSACLRSVMSCSANSQQASPFTSTGLMDCSTVRFSLLRVVRSTS